MPTPDNPIRTNWIIGTNFGKNYRLRFIDYGHDSLDLELDIKGQGIGIYGKVSRENSVRYENTHQDDEINSILHDILTNL